MEFDTKNLKLITIFFVFLFVLGIILFVSYLSISNLQPIFNNEDAVSYTSLLLGDTSSLLSLSFSPSAVPIATVKNNTWLEFDGIDDYLNITTEKKDMVYFKWNYTGIMTEVFGIDAEDNYYPVNYSEANYVFGKYNLTTFYSGKIDEIRLYNYSIPKKIIIEDSYVLFDGTNDYLQNSSASGLNVSGNNLTIIGWLKPRGVPEANMSGNWSMILTSGNEDYQLLAYDNKSRIAFGNKTAYVTTHSGLLVANPERWQFLAVEVNGSSVKFYSNRYPKEVYSMGDSITAGCCSNSSHFTSSDAYPMTADKVFHTYQYWLDYNMGSYSSAESSTFSFYNKGWSGQTCDEMISRWDNSTSGLKNNTIVMLMCGTNDGLTDSTEIKDDYDQIVSLASARNQTLLWGEIIPGIGCANQSHRDNMTDVNNYIQTLANANGFINVINWHMNLSNGTFGCRNNNLYWDTLHPNEEGYKKMAEIMWLEGFGGIDYSQTIQLQEQEEIVGSFKGIASSKNNNFTIGSDVSGTEKFYKGGIENLIVYNNTVGLSYINSIFNNGKEIQAIDNNYLVSAWRMNNTLTSSKGKNTLTSNGATLYNKTGGLIAFFNFDGDYNDLSENLYTGAVVNGSVNASEPGKYNQGLKLNGSFWNYLMMDNMNESLNLYDTDYVISFWMNSTTASASDFIIGNAVGGWSVAMVGFKIVLWIRDSDENIQTSNAFTIQSGKLYHILINYDKEKHLHSFYIDGLLNKTAVEEDGIPNIKLYNLTIGAVPGTRVPGFDYTGMIDDVAIYNKKMSPEEVFEIYENGLFELTAKYKLNENSGTTAYDSSAYENNGVISGGTLWNNDGITNSLNVGTDFSYLGSIFTILNPDYNWDLITVSYQVSNSKNTFENLSNNYISGTSEGYSMLITGLKILGVVLILSVIAFLIFYLRKKFGGTITGLG